MSSTVIRMRSESKTDLKYVSQAIISSSDMAGSELVLEQLSDANDATILLLVFEKVLSSQFQHDGMHHPDCRRWPKSRLPLS